MASTSDIRNGLIIEFKNGIYKIIEFLHVKPGKGQAFVKTKLRNMKTGKVLDNTFKLSDDLIEIRVTKQKKQYLYRDGDHYVFMDNETYDQSPVDAEVVEDVVKYLKEGMDVEMLISEKGEIIDIELPTTVIQEIAEAEPNVKGNTASGSGKNAITETGLAITVPFFVEAGEKVKIDTRTGAYIERA
ncbi:MAG: elongation factor P [Candidatus Cloacimonetes bacterium]|jgi:elongation factor P|nr:elongation factor P [Candidatus Cloacimonadota bacterium]MDD4155002.1 elongation factor P [Candidatus Cloacimonadota bacterium]